MKKLLTFILIILFGLFFVNLKPVAAETAKYNPVLITELQVGFSGKSNHEFIEIKNQSSDTQNIQIEYANPSSKEWKNILFQGKIADNAIFFVGNKEYLEANSLNSDHDLTTSLNNSSGAIRILSDDNEEDTQILDCVFWGEEFIQDKEFTENCQQLEGLPTENENGEQSFQRFLLENDELSDNFNIHSPISPSEIFLSKDENKEIPDQSEEPEINYPNIIISEIFPNPAPPNADSDYEFIELYNPNQKAVNLKDFKLESGSDFRYKFTIPSINIEPKQYLAFYSSETNLTLSNNGSKVRLTDPNNKELNQMEYSKSKEGYSWILLNNKWQLTSKSTPSNSNIFASPEPGKGSGQGADSNNLKPCREDQYRNPETNRCKKKVSISQLKACSENQERNPETNRCRKISSLKASLKPCDKGQFRNPETNRCKSVATTASDLKPCKPDQERNTETNRCRKKMTDKDSLKPCKEGQERNPETNRCRNIASISSKNNPSNDISSGNSPTNFKYIAAISILVIVYMIWQYRDDLKMKFWQLKQRLKPNQDHKN